MPFELHLSLWRCHVDCLESSENVYKNECKNKNRVELFSMVSKNFKTNNNDSEKDLRNEMLVCLATKQSVIQVIMHNTDLGQSVN